MAHIIINSRRGVVVGYIRKPEATSEDKMKDWKTINNCDAAFLLTELRRKDTHHGNRRSIFVKHTQKFFCPVVHKKNDRKRQKQCTEPTADLIMQMQIILANEFVIWGSVAPGSWILYSNRKQQSGAHWLLKHWRKVQLLCVALNMNMLQRNRKRERERFSLLHSSHPLCNRAEGQIAYDWLIWRKRK